MLEQEREAWRNSFLEGADPQEIPILDFVFLVPLEIKIVSFSENWGTVCG